MGKKLDLTGQQFGRLTVMREYGNDGTKHKRVLWMCKCVCGNESVVLSSKLTFGHTKSRGCYRYDKMRESCKINILGMRFGKLLVIKEYPSYVCGRVAWVCKCDCGNTTTVIGKNLRNGNTASCGCYGKQRRIEANSGENNWNWRGGITDLNQKIRDFVKKSGWGIDIFRRDGFSCLLCKHTSGGSLNAHHIIPLNEIIDYYNITTIDECKNYPLFFDLDNGSTLCKECHTWVHSYNNTDKNFIKSMEDYHA